MYFILDFLSQFFFMISILILADKYSKLEKKFNNLVAARGDVDEN